ERVVEEAVGDEAVAARVPEVVPEREAVLEEHASLVEVRREVGSGWPEPREKRREERRRGCGQHRLADERVAARHGSCGRAAATGGAIRRSTGIASARWTRPPSSESTTVKPASATGPGESLTRKDTTSAPKSAIATERSLRDRPYRATARPTPTSAVSGMRSHHCSTIRAYDSGTRFAATFATPSKPPRTAPRR